MAQGDVLNMSLDDIIKQKSSGPRKQDRKKVRRSNTSFLASLSPYICWSWFVSLDFALEMSLTFQLSG